MRTFFGPFYLLFATTVLVHSNGLGQQSAIDLSSVKTADPKYLDLQKQLERSKNNPAFPKKIAQNHLKLGEYYCSLGLYSEAMEQYNRALEQIGTNFNDTLYITLNNNIGKVYLSQNNFELAEQYFTETMNTAVNLDDSNGQAESMGLLGACYEKQGGYDKALAYQQESLLLFEQLKDIHGVAMTNENIGSIYEDLEQFDLAYEYFHKAYQHLQHSGTAEEVNVLNNLGG